LGRKALGDVVSAAKPETLLRWHRELIATKFDGSKYRESVGHKIITLNIIAGSVDSEHEPLMAEGTARVTVTENML